jgi:hypothetical protein
MMVMKNLGNVKLSTIAKVCIFLMLVLLTIGAGIGITRSVQAKQERNQLNAINNSLEQQGLSMKTKNLILQFIDKYHQTQNIVVTDNNDNIVYNANKNVIGSKTTFVLEPDQYRLGIFKLKDSSIKFAANPRSVVPFIQRDSQNQNANLNVYNYNDRRMTGSYGYNQNIRVMINGRFGNGIIPKMQDRFDGREKDGYRVTRFMGPGMMGAGSAYGIPNSKFGLDGNTLFLSSYRADNKGINIFYISKGFEQNNLMTVLFITFILLKLLFIILWVLLAIWVYKDSKSRGMNEMLWGLITLFTGLFGLIIYLIVKNKTRFCHECGHKAGKEDNYCIECGALLKLKCQKCESCIKPDWNYCANCGEKLEENE